MYFKDWKPGRTPSAREGIGAAAHLQKQRFNGAVENTALHFVADDAFLREVDPAGRCQVDPTYKLFTGWLLRPRGRAFAYDADRFPPRATLVAAA